MIYMLYTSIYLLGNNDRSEGSTDIRHVLELLQMLNMYRATAYYPLETTGLENDERIKLHVKIFITTAS